MKTLLFITMFILITLSEALIIDFGQSAENKSWSIVNDGVMGGKSQSQVIEHENSLIFSGEISLKNNGGFASLQSPKKEQDLSTFTHVAIKYRSSGQDFALRLLKYQAFYRPHFKHHFKPTDGEWQLVSIPLEDFKEYVLSSPTGASISKIDLQEVIRLGIIVSNEKEGPFSIEIDYIKFV